MKNKLYIITTALFLLVGMGSANARPIPPADQVTVDGKTWAKVDIFSGLSWDIINAQCPAGVCGANSTLNGFDMAGWVWATSHETVKMLNTFNPYPPLGSGPGSMQRGENMKWVPKVTKAFGCQRIWDNMLGAEGLIDRIVGIMRDNRTPALAVWITDNISPSQSDGYELGQIKRSKTQNDFSAFFYKAR